MFGFLKNVGQEILDDVKEGSQDERNRWVYLASESVYLTNILYCNFGNIDVFTSVLFGRYNKNLV